ncbi:MAG: carboxypeptidase-like regulatory domain-containing protein [Bacteroidales bacterium]|nr:carboxypeptidase-like regulatory domain-containing protein [Bacteroidales bacterium]
MSIRVKYISLLIFLVGYNIALSQTRISETFNGKPLNKVLDLISKNYSIKFAYDNSALDSIVVSGSFRNESIDDVLNLLLKKTNLEVLHINEVYIIKKRIVLPKTEIKAEIVKPIKYRVLGIVKEKGTGESLPYASVAVQETQNGTSTNTDGYFSLLSNKTDSLTLMVSYLGFQPVQLKVAPLSKNEIITIELNRNNTVISDIIVIKSQHESLAVEDEPSVYQWNSKNNATSPCLSNLDIAAPLQLLPGIDGTTESLSGLVVRHSPSDKNLFVYDGFTIYHIDHFFGAFTSFNSKAIKDIRITRGGFDSHWGGRVSSVIEITGKTGNEKKFITDIGLDQLSSDIELEGPIGKKTTFVFAARRSFTDLYHSNLYYNLFESARSDLSLLKKVPTSFTTDPSQPGYYYYDMNAKVSFKPSSKDIISVSGYQGYDNLNLNTPESIPVVKENSNWGNKGAGIRWSRQWNNVFYHNITAGISNYNMYYDHFDYRLRPRLIDDTISSNKLLINNKINDINLNFNGELKIGSTNNIEFGLTENIVSIASQEGNSHYALGTKIIDTLRVYDNQVSNSTFWAQGLISSGALKAFRFGGRITYNDLTNKFYIEPRSQLEIQLSKKLSIKMAAGLYYQFVNRVNSYNNGSYKSIWKVSDGDRFPVVKSTHLIGGFLWDVGAGFSIDCEGYTKKTNNLSFEQSTIKKTDQGKIVEEQKVAQLNNNTFGVDVLLKKNWSKGQSWVSYSLSRSLNQSKKLNGGREYPALDDHLSELKIVNVINLKHWDFTIAWIYGSGNPWDEILLTSLLQLSPNYEKNSARLSPYNRIDLGLNYNFKIKNGELKIGAKVFNLLDGANTLSKPYQLSDTPYQDYIDGKSPIVYKEIPGMGFTPSFFINLRF